MYVLVRYRFKVYLRSQRQCGTGVRSKRGIHSEIDSCGDIDLKSSENNENNKNKTSRNVQYY